MGNCCSALDQNTSLLIIGYTKREMVHGPGWKYYGVWNDVKVIKKIVLNAEQYLEILHMKTDQRDSGHNDDIIEHISGPCIYQQEDPFATVSQPKNKIELLNTQFIIVTNGKTGQRKTVEGPTLYMPLPYESCSQVTNKIILNNNQYIYITDTSTGHIEIKSGPLTFALGPYEQCSSVLNKINLNMLQYIKIIDKNTGIMRIVSGPDVVMLNPYESIIKDANNTEIRTAITVNANNAVLVRDTQTGVEELITTPQKYIPAANIDIIEVRKMIKLATYERMVLIDKESKLFFKSGETEKGFFLPPFCSILSQRWSTDRNRAIEKNTKVEIFDIRPHDMDFEFSVRSCDNVEIKMVVNVYWNIENIERMVKATSDPPQDICNHVRSQVLSISSKMTTKDLMEYSTSELIKSIYDEDLHFYEMRGVKVSRIDILEKKCADPGVEKTYRAIIDTKIERVGNLEKQRGDNDKRVAEIEGEISIESHRNNLLLQKMKNMDLENRTQGESEGAKIKMFFDGLGTEISLEDKMKIYMETLRSKRIEVVAGNVKQLYVKPDDVGFNLNLIELKDDNKKQNVTVALQLDNKK